jgi:hypothetical protein
MAICGFYEIRTFETLSRDYGTNHTHFESLFKKEGSEAQPKEEAKEMNKRQ